MVVRSDFQFFFDKQILILMTSFLSLYHEYMYEEQSVTNSEYRRLMDSRK